MNFAPIIKQYPILSAEEELELAKRYKLHNDLEAAEKLVLHHIRLVFKIANNYRKYPVSFDDMVQEGIIGLMKAVKSFDYTKGVRLMSHAVYSIKERIINYVQDNFRLVKIVTTKAHKKLFWNRAIVTEDENVLEKFDVTQKQLEDFETRYAGGEAVIDDTILQVACPLPTPEEYMLEQDDQKQLEWLKQAVNALDNRSRYIIQSRHLTDEPKTFAELAQELGVSLQRVKQIEQVAFDKIKKDLINVTTK